MVMSLFLCISGSGFKLKIAVYARISRQKNEYALQRNIM